MDMLAVLMGTTMGDTEVTVIPASAAAITIAADKWTATEETEAASTGYSYYQDISISGLSAGSCTYTSLSPASLAVARTAGMASAATALAGRIRYFTISLPDTDMDAQVLILKSTVDGTPGFGSVNSTGDIGVNATLNAQMRVLSIRWFERGIYKYGLSLSEYGKIREVWFYSLNDSHDLSEEEITEIFGDEDPAEMETADFCSAVVRYTNLSMQDILSVFDLDADYRISATYLPSREAIRTWLESHNPYTEVHVTVE